MKIFRIIPPPITAVLLVILFYFAGSLFPITQEVLFRSTSLGVVLILIGLGLMLMSAVIFKKKHTTLNPNGKPNHLVDIGPFAYTRNPMYLGVVIALIGYAVMQSNVLVYLAPVTFFLLMNSVVIPFEEKQSRLALGEKYEEYTKRVRRWI